MQRKQQKLKSGRTDSFRLPADGLCWLLVNGAGARHLTTFIAFCGRDRVDPAQIVISAKLMLPT